MNQSFPREHIHLTIFKYEYLALATSVSQKKKITWTNHFPGCIHIWLLKNMSTLHWLLVPDIPWEVYQDQQQRSSSFIFSSCHLVWWPELDISLEGRSWVSQAVLLTAICILCTWVLTPTTQTDAHKNVESLVNL